MEVDSTRVCELLVGLGDIEVLGVEDDSGEPLRVHVRRRTLRPDCVGCGGQLWSDGERLVVLVDLPASAGRRGWSGTSAGGAVVVGAVRWAPSPSRPGRSRCRVRS